MPAVTKDTKSGTRIGELSDIASKLTTRLEANTNRLEHICDRVLAEGRDTDGKSDDQPVASDESLSGLRQRLNELEIQVARVQNEVDRIDNL